MKVILLCKYYVIMLYFIIGGIFFFYFSITSTFSAWKVVYCYNQKSTRAPTPGMKVSVQGPSLSFHPPKAALVCVPTSKGLGPPLGGPSPVPALASGILLCAFCFPAQIPDLTHWLSLIVCVADLMPIAAEKLNANFILISFLEGQPSKRILRDAQSCFLLNSIRGRGKVAKRENGVQLFMVDCSPVCLLINEGY